MRADTKMFADWISAGLKKPGKDQYGLADVLNIDRSNISKLKSGQRPLRAHEIELVASYIEEAPPARIMQISFEIGAGQEVRPIDGDGPLGHEAVSGMWGVRADLAIVRGDSMWPLIPAGGRIFIGEGRSPLKEDNRQMRAVTLEDGRMFIKVMRRTSDARKWTLESFNAPPIEDVEVTRVGVILRIEPSGIPLTES